MRQGPWLNDIVENGSADATRARLGIEVAGTMLTHHEDIWTERAADEILVPHAVLAEWFVGSWWRLMCEPKPKHHGPLPKPDWRMAHEIAAAGGGCVWPFIGFATDLKAMRVFSDLLPDRGTQSVRYTSALERPAQVCLGEFQSEIKRFVQRVVDHLRFRGCESDLPDAWSFLNEEIAHPGYAAWRQAEARLGYDPGEGPDDQIEQALELGERMGAAASAEILPAFGHAGIGRIQEIAVSLGIKATPPVFPDFTAGVSLADPPWRVGYAYAKQFRKSMHAEDGPVSTGRLSEWTGIREHDLEDRNGSQDRLPAAIAVADSQRGFTFHMRGRHPSSRRFEVARFIGDLVLNGIRSGEWLAATELATWRQQFQRTFASELLCPADALRDYQKDVEREEFTLAAEHFQVSEEVVRWQYDNQIAQ
ncbi:MAG: hypothetical protein HQ464_03245 [Planctomycetes bacterium]|nr:hypothetical protein [Planctomycetota bacterium]